MAWPGSFNFVGFYKQSPREGRLCLPPSVCCLLCGVFGHCVWVAASFRAAQCSLHSDQVKMLQCCFQQRIWG